MGRKNFDTQEEYRVMVSVWGNVSRTVLADSQEEARRIVEKMLFQTDKQTPQSKILCAFEWDIPRFNVFGKRRDDPLMIDAD